MDFAVAALLITILGVGAYYFGCKRQVNALCGGEDDIEIDGEQRTRIRHEGGL